MLLARELKFTFYLHYCPVPIRSLKSSCTTMPSMQIYWRRSVKSARRLESSRQSTSPARITATCRVSGRYYATRRMATFIPGCRRCRSRCRRHRRYPCRRPCCYPVERLCPLQIYVDFLTKHDATMASHELAGRHFDGQIIQAAFLDEADFDSHQLDNHGQPHA